MKYGVRKFYDLAQPEGGGGPAIDPKEFKTTMLKELGTIKAALDKNLTDKMELQQKNLDEKLEEVNGALKALQEAPASATIEELKAIKDDLDITIKAFDKLQTRQKQQSMRVSVQQDDTSLFGHISKAFDGFKSNIEKGNISKGANEISIQTKTVGDMTIASNLTGNIPNTYRAGIVPVPFEMVHFRDLVNTTPSSTDSYHFFRHSVGEGTIDFQVQELATKQQIDEDLTEVTVNLDYLAGWLRISRKMLRNFAGLQAYISRWLPERYYQREDTKAYQVLIGQATGVADTTGTDIISQIIRTIGKQKKARYNVTGIVCDGEVWSKILTFKASTSGEFTMPIGVVTISSTGQLMICGIPVYTASWVGGDEVLIGDWRNFEIIQSESLSLQFFEQDGTNVRENKITARIESCVGFAVLDPKAFAVLSVESVS